jgi:hypothetical protein
VGKIIHLFVKKIPTTPLQALLRRKQGRRQEEGWKNITTLKKEGGCIGLASGSRPKMRSSSDRSKNKKASEQKESERQETKLKPRLAAAQGAHMKQPYWKRANRQRAQWKVRNLKEREQVANNQTK